MGPDVYAPASGSGFSLPGSGHGEGSADGFIYHSQHFAGRLQKREREWEDPLSSSVSDADNASSSFARREGSVARSLATALYSCAEERREREEEG